MLLTRSPLSGETIACISIPYDLHALSTPPAFVLSQDQTLRKKRSILTESGLSDPGGYCLRFPHKRGYRTCLLCDFKDRVPYRQRTNLDPGSLGVNALQTAGRLEPEIAREGPCESGICGWEMQGVKDVGMRHQKLLRRTREHMGARAVHSLCAGRPGRYYEANA